jgi:hypothetical protein
MFYESPYPVSMGQYYMIQIIFQLIAACSYCLFILLVSSFSKNTFVSFAVSGFVYTNLIWMDFDGGGTNAILQFSYYGMMKVNGLFQQFETVSLFGYPILVPIVAIALLFLVSVLWLKIIYEYNRFKYLT